MLAITTGSIMFITLRPALSANAEIIASVVSSAEPIAKPLPIAAVVLPRASNLSVILRTDSPKPAISAIPPALSAIGPYASTLMVIPTVASIETAASETPNKPPPNWNESKMIIAKMITGATVDSIPTDKPVIIFVAAPDSELFATSMTGLPDV